MKRGPSQFDSYLVQERLLQQGQGRGTFLVDVGEGVGDGLSAFVARYSDLVLAWPANIKLPSSQRLTSKTSTSTIVSCVLRRTLLKISS